jgi:site-specific DNA-methyltransferase (adenine-specific)
LSRIETIGDATLYLGDCLEILPTLPKVDAVITDPPYGTGWVRGGKSVGVFEAKHEKPDWDVFSTDWLAHVWRHGYVAAFCAPSYLDRMAAAFDTPHVGRYRKTNVRPGGREYEYIVASAPWRTKRWEVPAYNGDNEYHPTQKPLQVMDWCIDQAPAGASVLDPFMGSGSTGVAAVSLGRSFIGIEREPGFFATACERIDNAYRQQRMFA